jgi:hypothetical protein
VESRLPVTCFSRCDFTARVLPTDSSNINHDTVIFHCSLSRPISTNHSERPVSLGAAAFVAKDLPILRGGT